MSEDRIDDEKCVRTETIPFGTVATITIPAGYLLHRKGRLVRVAKSPEEIGMKRIKCRICTEPKEAVDTSCRSLEADPKRDTR